MPIPLGDAADVPAEPLPSADDALDLALGDEGIEKGLYHLLVGVGQMFDGLELAQEIAIGDAGSGRLVAGALEQIVAGGVQRVGEPLEGVAAGARGAALEPANPRTCRRCLTGGHAKQKHRL